MSKFNVGDRVYLSFWDEYATIRQIDSSFSQPYVIAMEDGDARIAVDEDDLEAVG